MGILLNWLLWLQADDFFTSDLADFGLSFFAQDMASRVVASDRIVNQHRPVSMNADAMIRQLRSGERATSELQKLVGSVCHDRSPVLANG